MYPSAANTATVTGSVFSGTVPASGYVTFQIPVWLLDEADGTCIQPGDINAVLGAPGTEWDAPTSSVKETSQAPGTFSVVVPMQDGFTPDNWLYEVIVNLEGSDPHSFQCAVTHDTTLSALMEEAASA